MADIRPENRSSDTHDLHDPEPIVALLDRDLDAAARARGQAMVDACSRCAALFHDIRTLAEATVALPAGSRPRDFLLTAQDAAKLRNDARGEPVPSAARLSRDMNDSSPRHATHDRLIIAGLVDRTVDERERARAEAQLAACDACARLHADLVALSAATRELPTPNRTRDFTLSTADAERLRVRGWRRILGVFGSAGDVFSRPLAIGLTTLGLAGLLMGTIPGALSGLASGPAAALAPVGDSQDGRSAGAAGGAAPEFTIQASGPAASAAPEPPADVAASAAPEAAAAAASEEPIAAGSLESEDPDVLFEGGESNQMAGEPTTGDQFYRVAEAEGGPSPLLLVGGTLLLAGLALFGLRWIGRRASQH